VWILVALTPLILLLGVLGVMLWYRFSNDAAVRKLEAKIKERGEPLTLADLAAAYPPIPDEENAAVLLMDLWEKEDPEFWKAFRAGARPLPDRKSTQWPPDLPYLGRNARLVARTNALTAANLATTEAHILSNKVHCAAIRDALKQRPKVRFQVEITDGFGALLPHLPSMKVEAQHLRIAVLLAIERDDVAGSIAALQDSRRLANALQQGPFLIDQLVRIAMHGMILTDCERLVSRQTLDPASLADLAALFESMQMKAAFKKSLLSERAASLSIYDMPAASLAMFDKSADGSGEEPINAAHAQFGIKLVNVTGIVSADRRFLLEIMEEAVRLAEEDTPESLAGFETLFKRVEDEALRFPPKLIAGLMLPALNKAAQKFAAVEARRRSALTAIAVEKYRLEHQGRLPSDLDELIPRYMERVPGDPFDGQALRFRPLEKGFVVYSVGADRVDHQGRERPQRGLIKDYDETFFVER
jgi:hypothetical protein